MITGGLEGGASWSAFVVDVGSNFFYIISHTFVVGALVSLHIYLRKTPESAGVLSWIILAIIYIPIIAFPMLMAYGPQSKRASPIAPHPMAPARPAAPASPSAAWFALLAACC